MRPELVQMAKHIRDTHQGVYILAERMRSEVTKTVNLADLADTAFFAYKCAELVDDMRKELNKLNELASKMACLVHMKHLEGGAKDEPIRTPYCTATPECTMQVKLPTRKNDPEAFAKFMEYYKIPRELWDTEETEVFRPHWPGIQARISQDLAAGRPVPPGVNTATATGVFKMRFLTKCEPGDAP